MEITATYNTKNIIDTAKHSFISLREDYKTNLEKVFSTEQIEENVKLLTRAMQMFVDSVLHNKATEKSMEQFTKNPNLFLSSLAGFVEIQKDSKGAAVVGDDLSLYIINVHGYNKVFQVAKDEFDPIQDSESIATSVIVIEPEINKYISYNSSVGQDLTSNGYSFDKMGKLTTDELDTSNLIATGSRSSDIKDSIEVAYEELVNNIQKDFSSLR